MCGVVGGLEGNNTQTINSIKKEHINELDL
jgi:hypothetical protein